MSASTTTSSAPIASAEPATRRRLLALWMGLLNHGTFLVAVTAMLLGLFDGLQSGRGSFAGSAAWIANTVLVLQFPLLHSFLLTARGRGLMARLFGRHGRTLAPTTYTWSAALQILAVFALWSPSGSVWFEPRGGWLVAHTTLFLAAWLFLLKALYDGGMGLQTGSIGWLALLRGTKPNFPPLPVRGTFAVCRQPIYLGFALTLWTGPVWTPDRLLIALLWTTYCVIGPRHKERRFRALHGEAFASYQKRVPYMLPLRRRAA
jgi:protein-S-isoprenylcysteine O-methyltransferase Ste14